MHTSPAKIILLFFLIAILLGTFFLSLPISLARPGQSKFIDTIFTATSAVCVTGLSVVDIGTYYSIFGQITILLLIQIGGLGYMTFGSILMIFFGKLSLKNRLVVQEATDILSYENVGYFLKQVVKLTFIVELIGAIILTVCFMIFLPETTPFLKAMYYGIFHSISAFCNSGLSLFKESFILFNKNALVLLTMALLVITGGIGYFVIVDLFLNRFKWRNTSLHTKIVLSTTFVLIITGTFLIFFLEKNNVQTIATQSLGYKVLNSFFQAVTPRTAGFSTIGMSNLMPATILVIMVLMFIGASPGGTGGGIKTSTFFILIKTFISSVFGKRQVNIYNRRIRFESIRKAFSIFIGFSLVIIVLCFLLLVFAKQNILPTLFEAISATGTVGLSLGITPDLNAIGKLLVVLTMLIGRIGPLTIGLAILFLEESEEFKYPEEKIMVG